MLLLVVIAIFKRDRLSVWLMAALLLLEILAVNALIAVNGGASNPFNVILLVPIVLAFMLLPLSLAIAIQLISIAAQSAQLLLLPVAGHHAHNMQSHYHGMIIGFVFTSLLIGIVIRYFRRQLAKREQLLHELRERQLRDEQLLAIGTAAAQLTHDVATPAQTIRLLLEEAQENTPRPPWLAPLCEQFSRIEQQLSNWRDVANDVREKRTRQFSVQGLWTELQSLMRVARPEADISWTASEFGEQQVTADRTLLSSLSSVIVNACEATTDGQQEKVQLTSSFDDDCWLLTIENAVPDLCGDNLERLGSEIMPSERGHGVGAILSNATLEKFNGEVSWHLANNRLTTTIKLPYGFAHENTDH